MRDLYQASNESGVLYVKVLGGFMDVYEWANNASGYVWKWSELFPVEFVARASHDEINRYVNTGQIPLTMV